MEPIELVSISQSHQLCAGNANLILSSGGKAKPLKAPKKAPKGEMDEEDKAFQEKQKAGRFCRSTNRVASVLIPQQMPKQKPKWQPKPREAKGLSTPDPKESRRVERNEWFC